MKYKLTNRSIYNHGFTILELMIVVAIIGILAAIAIPQYQRYIIRSQVTEGLNLGGNPKIAVTQFYDNHGRFPKSNNQAGLKKSKNISGKYVSSVSIQSNKKLRVNFGGKPPQSHNVNASLKNKAMLFSPYTSPGGDVVFNCEEVSKGNKPIPKKYLPSTCR